MSFAVPTVTGDAGYWNRVSSINGDNATYAPLFARSSAEMNLSRLFAKRGSGAVLRGVLKALNGVVAGSSGAVSYTRVASHTPFDTVTMGGVRGTETYTQNSGNTTTAQRDYLTDKVLDALFNQNPTSYPADASGISPGRQKYW